MILEPIISAIVLALLITIIFSTLFKNKNNGGWGIGLFFLILFLVMWAGGLWLNPVAPYVWGVSWVPILFIGLIAALLLSVTERNPKKENSKTESNPPNPRDGEERHVVTVSEGQHRDAIAISLFFWALMAVLILAIIAGYFIHS